MVPGFAERKLRRGANRRQCKGITNREVSGGARWFLDRANDKTFRQFVLTSKRGWRIKRPDQARDLLYRWPTLAASYQIFLVNGEKAADRGAQQLGLCTTCHLDGEGAWHMLKTFFENICL